jgi:hypothetical protein
MSLKLIDGRGRPVEVRQKAISKALTDTDIVLVADQEDIAISFFYSDLGDEIDVSDGFDTHLVFEMNEVSEAIAEFLILCGRR